MECKTPCSFREKADAIYRILEINLYTFVDSITGYNINGIADVYEKCHTLALFDGKLI